MLHDLKQLVHLNQQNEQERGYSHGVRIGPFVQVSKTYPLTPEGSIAFPGDQYWQTKLALETAMDVFVACGGLKNHINKVTIYIKQGCEHELIERGFAELMQHTTPCISHVIVPDFIYKKCLVAVELSGIAINYQPVES